MIDTKKALAEIMSRRKAPKRITMGSTNELPDLDEKGDMDPKHIAAEEMMAAFHEKSSSKLAKAMAAFHDLHNLSKDEMSESEDS